MVPPLRRGDGDSRVRGDDGTGGWIAACGAMTGRGGGLGAGAEAEEVGVAEGEGEADALAG